MQTEEKNWFFTSMYHGEIRYPPAAHGWTEGGGQNLWVSVGGEGRWFVRFLKLKQAALTGNLFHTLILATWDGQSPIERQPELIKISYGCVKSYASIFL